RRSPILDRRSSTAPRIIPRPAATVAWGPQTAGRWRRSGHSAGECAYRSGKRGPDMQREPAESGPLLGPLEYHSLVPVEPAAASHLLGWTGLEAARFCDLTDAEVLRPALTHHSLILFTEPPAR